MAKNTIKKTISIENDVYDLIEARLNHKSSNRSKIVNDLLKEQLVIPKAAIENTIEDLLNLSIIVKTLSADIDNLTKIEDREVITPTLKIELNNFKTLLPDLKTINNTLKLLILIDKYQIK